MPIHFDRNPPYAQCPEGVNRPHALSVGVLPLTTDGSWQMSFGERAALEGILSQVKPDLAIEVGTAMGGALMRIAAHSAEVHSVDITHANLERAVPDNVTLHTGSSETLLKPLLAEFAAAERGVDLVLIDGDHSFEGVAGDLEVALRSESTGRTVIVLHDTMNAEVRAGIESVQAEGWEKVVYVELDLVPGYLYRSDPLRHQAWGGLGLVLTDHQRASAYRSPRQSLYVEPFTYTQAARAILTADATD